jgi:hypothetical protein
MEQLTGLFMLVVAMVANPQTEERNMFFVYKPLFENIEQCMTYVNYYPQYWVPKVAEAYPNGEIDQVLCVSIDKMNEFMKENPNLLQEQQEEEGLNT